MSRIKSLVKSRAVSIKGVSYIILFIKSIKCRNITKVALVIGYKIKLYVIQRLRIVKLLVLLAFTYNACQRLNLPNINNFLIALQHLDYFTIFKII